ncbi:MAG: hypothetical protein OES25_06380, partial [Acidobacteriota bacterium]|nr:hypothetical protein [Acidobacteriota bacterium]
AVAADSYPFQIQATDGAINRNIPVSVIVADMAPGAPQPDQPADGQTDTARSPDFSWLSSPQAVTYRLEIASDTGFLNVLYDVVVSSVSHMPTITLDPVTPYYWRVSAENACGVSVQSATFQFTTRPVPDLLVVDDDDNGPDVRATYTDALDTLGLPYDIWDTGNSDDEPSAEALAPYKKVIWFTGDEFGGSAGPGPGGESALASWLDSSACLLLSSQDYYYDRGATGFVTGHLGVASATSDVGQTSAEGAGTLFGGFGTYTLSFPYTNYTDDIVPDVTAEGAFIGSTTNLSSVDKDTGVYRTLFMSIGVETLPTATDQENALSDFITWCDALGGLDPDSDGTPNGGDCAPGDPDNWSPPGEARSLFMTTAPADNLDWQAPIAPGAILVSYDVLRADGAQAFAAATCLASDIAGPTATETLVPVVGQAYYYLIRSRNGCGDSLGSQRAQPGVTCP